MKNDLQGFHDLLSVSIDLPILCFSADGKMTDAVGSNEHAESAFLRSGCKDKLFAYVQSGSRPVILSSRFGIMWGTTIEYRKGRVKCVYVIGPAQTSHLSAEDLRTQLDRNDLPLTFKYRAFYYIRSVPYLPYRRLADYTLMLHYFINNEKLLPSDLVSLETDFSVEEQETDSDIQGTPSALPGDAAQDDPDVLLHAPGYRDYLHDWDIEQAMASSIEEGQFDYEPLLSELMHNGTGVNSISSDALVQSHYNGVILTNTCIHALIHAGASVETSFRLGEEYQRRIAAAVTVPQVQELIREMFHAFVEEGYQLKHKPLLSPNIQRCCEYINAHLYEDLSVKVLASRLHYSAPYLERKFRSEMQTSITNYIYLVRLEHAKTLLITTDQPIARIAETLHFCSSSHFSTRFRAYTGILPLAYRKQYRHV